MQRRLTLIVVIVITIFTLLSLFEIVNAVFIVHSTGVLQVKTSDPTATITVSGINQQAEYIGLGDANIRLKPGTYLVGAIDQNAQTMASVNIIKGQTVSRDLNIENLVKQTDSNNKLIAKLPFSGPAGDYSINYYMDYKQGQSYPVITIDSSSEQTREAALDWMKYYNFNPANYDIVYKTITLPTSNGNYFVGGNP